MSRLAARVVVVAENTAGARGVLGEHGLSLWIETPDARVLFDTGQGLALARNSAALGIDLARTDAIALSHGHYDHTGGLPCALARAPRARVCLHPAALAVRFNCRDGVAREVGMPPDSRRAVEAAADRILWTRGPAEVAPGFRVTGPVPRRSGFEDTGGPFFLEAAGATADPLEDDQALWLDTAAGLVVLLGCAHAGIVNTVRYIRELAPGRPIRAVIGGAHLAAASEARLARTVEALRAFEIQRLMLLHCTGFAAAARLWREFPGRVSTGSAGAIWECTA